jgi:hypothetical protein
LPGGSPLVEADTGRTPVDAVSRRAIMVGAMHGHATGFAPARDEEARTILRALIAERRGLIRRGVVPGLADAALLEANGHAIAYWRARLERPPAERRSRRAGR